MDIKIVLVDDDVLIRQSIKILLNSIEEKSKAELNIFSSGNGVEGVGYVFIINPEIIIVDTTLPKYSGREMIDFLVTNPKFNSKLMFVLHDEALPLNNLPSNYIVLNKRDRDFIHDFTVLIERYINNKVKSLEETLNVKDVVEISKYSGVKKINLTLRKLLIQKTLTWANRSDRLMHVIADAKRRNLELIAKINGEKIENENIFIRILKLLRKIILFPFWVICQFFSSLYLSILLLISPKVRDGNIRQGREDILAFRVKAYPTLAGVSVSLIFILLQVLIFIVGGIVILNNIRIDSVFADMSSEVVVNFENVEYDSNEIEQINGTFRLKAINTPVVPEPSDVEEIPTTPEITEEINTPDNTEVQPLPEENLENVVEEEAGEVQGVSTDISSQVSFSMNNPSIIFKQKISFVTLHKILEESSVNSSLSSVEVLTTEQKSELKTRDSLITYHLSPDLNSWFYFGTQGWEETQAGYSSSNVIQEVNEYLQQYISTVGGNDLYIKAYLHSNGNVQTSLNSLKVQREVYIVANLNQGEEVSDGAQVQSILDVSNIDTPVSYTETGDETQSVNPELPVPTIFNASSLNGKKIVTGKILGTDIKDEDFQRFKIRVYFTGSTNISAPATDYSTLIGETNLSRNSRGEVVFTLEADAPTGGWITSQLIFEDNIVSGLSKPSES